MSEGKVATSVGDVADGGDGVAVEEEAFENQRYIPLQGWATANLLPTDRMPWTNRSGRRGAEAMPRITPLPAWEWISKVCHLSYIRSRLDICSVFILLIHPLPCFHPFTILSGPWIRILEIQMRVVGAMLSTSPQAPWTQTMCQVRRKWAKFTSCAAADGFVSGAKGRRTVHNICKLLVEQLCILLMLY